MSTGGPVALFPGSFDPLTRGHEDVVRRSLTFVERVVVAVAHQPSESKAHLFPVDRRLELIREVFEGEPRVDVESFSGLAVEFARARGAAIVVRGLRSAGDFEYESRMARMNRQLAAEVDTVYLAADPRHVYLSASLVREVFRLGGDVSPFVPEAVLRRMLADRASR